MPGRQKYHRFEDLFLEEGVILHHITGIFGPPFSPPL